MARKPAVRNSTASAAKPVPATRSVASAVLRRKRHRSQQEHERRDLKRSMHTLIICSTWPVQPRNWYLARRELGQYPDRPCPESVYRFLAFAFAFGLAAGFFAFSGCLAAGLATCLTGFPLASTGAGLALGLAFAGGAATAAATIGGAAALFPLPFATSPFLPGAAATGTAAAAGFGPRPRRGGGGGGGGGGANGFRNFKVSVRERSFPSSSSINTSRAIFGYSGSAGVISNSVISGNGMRCCTCRHLVRKFLIFCATVW